GQSIVDFCDLLLVDGLSVQRNDIVLGLVDVDGTLCSKGLVAEIAQPLLQPACCPAIGIEFRIELVRNIGIGYGVDDLRGPGCGTRIEADLKDVAEPDTPD